MPHSEHTGCDCNAAVVVVVVVVAAAAVVVVVNTLVLLISAVWKPGFATAASFRAPTAFN